MREYRLQRRSMAFFSVLILAFCVQGSFGWTTLLPKCTKQSMQPAIQLPLIKKGGRMNGMIARLRALDTVHEAPFQQPTRRGINMTHGTSRDTEVMQVFSADGR